MQVRACADRGGTGTAVFCQLYRGHAAARPFNRDEVRSMRFLLLLCLLLVPLTARAQELTVCAAASLTDAMKNIAQLWFKAGHQPLRLSFGSSSTLARQIEQGAPANLFASADLKWMDFLADKKLIVPETRKDLLSNDVVLVVPADKPQHVTIGPG